MEQCKESYKVYINCMNNNNLKHHKNTVKRYIYCGKTYSNFLKCINSINTDLYITNSKCEKFLKKP